jgi:hypothetical protein
MRWAPAGETIAAWMAGWAAPASPDEQLARSLTAAAHQRENERASILRSWQAARRARDRAVRRASRAIPRSAAAGAGMLAVAVPIGGTAGEFCAGFGALFGIRAACAVATLANARRRPGGVPLPVLPPSLPVPPPVHSAAFPPLRRLTGAGASLRQLLLAGRCQPAAAAAADAAMAAAAEAERALHARAAQVATLESARAAVIDAAARAALDAAIRPLLTALDDGIVAYERLVVAAADLAATAVGSVEGVGPAGGGRPTDRLQEAADSLTGLAHGLRTVAAVQVPAVPADTVQVATLPGPLNGPVHRASNAG